MSWLEDLDRGKYVLLLAKAVPQRPEHIASRIKKFPSMYPLKFHHLKTFEKIPEHFIEIYHAILRLGIDVDDTPYGTYALTVQGRGKGAGHFKAGAKINYDSNGIRVYDVSFRNRYFLEMLLTAKDIILQLSQRQAIDDH